MLKSDIFLSKLQNKFIANRCRGNGRYLAEKRICHFFLHILSLSLAKEDKASYSGKLRSSIPPGEEIFFYLYMGSMITEYHEEFKELRNCSDKFGLENNT
jgi:hypothetical protein